MRKEFRVVGKTSWCWREESALWREIQWTNALVNNFILRWNSINRGYCSKYVYEIVLIFFQLYVNIFEIRLLFVGNFAVLIGLSDAVPILSV